MLGKLFATRRQRINALVAAFIYVVAIGSYMLIAQSLQNPCDTNSYSNECETYKRARPAHPARKFYPSYCTERSTASACEGYGS